MLTFIQRNGAVFTGISLMPGSAFTISSEPFSFDKNTSPKSNEAGAEEIGQRRIESSDIQIRADFACQTDSEYRTLINTAIASFHETIYINDTETNSKLSVAPKGVDIDYDDGCFRRSGQVSFKFERMSPFWESNTVSEATFPVASGGVTYNTVNFGNCETRSRIVILPETDLTSVDLVSLVQGINSYPDRIVGVVSIADDGAVICDDGRGIVINNVTGECYTSPKNLAGDDVTDADRVDIKEYIKGGTSFYRQGVGTHIFTITVDSNCDIIVRWNERFVA